MNISSVHSVSTSRNISAYAASKGALTSLTRAIALEYAHLQIRCNAVLLAQLIRQCYEMALTEVD